MSLGRSPIISLVEALLGDLLVIRSLIEMGQCRDAEEVSCCRGLGAIEGLSGGQRK